MTQINATDLLEIASRRADAAELYELRSFSLPVRFRAGALESVKAVSTAGRALRIVEDGRLGFSTTTDMTDDAQLIENGRVSAQFGDRAPFELPSEALMPSVACFDEDVDDLDEEAMIELGASVVERLEAYDDTLQIEVSVDKSVNQVRLLNTAGLDLEERRTAFSMSVEATRAAEGDILIVYDAASSRRRSDVDAAALADGVIERLRWAEEAAQVESEPMPVVFRSLGVLPLFIPLMQGLNGRQAYLGASPLAERGDHQVLDERFTLVDDGRLDFASRSASFDDEGVPTFEKPLIERGVVRHFLYDLKTAAQTGSQPTGNGFKSGGISGGGFRRPPGVSPSTWVVPPGQRSLEAILADLDEALLVDQVIGLGQGNVLAGEFSNNVSVGFLVRNGEIVGRVKNTMVAGNVYDLLKERLIALSDEPRWVYGLLQVPAVAIDSVSVVSKG
jgi:PmbA protein